MKKIITILTFIFLCLPVLAEYKPIPADLSNQYKVEMEEVINNNYPKVINAIDEYYNYVETTKNVPEVSVYDLSLFLYSDLMKITQEKYLGDKYTPEGTDCVCPVSEVLYPYFIDNNVNFEKIKQLHNYAQKKEKALARYMN